MFKRTQRLWDVLGEILAIVLVITCAIWIIDLTFPFIHNQTILNIIDFIRSYGTIALVGVVGLEAMSRRNFILQILFISLFALIIIFSFFPETFQEIVGIIERK